MTFRHRLALHRIERMKKLLLSTHDSISALSRQCGFKTPQACRDVFFRLEYTFPSMFRKKSASNQ